MNKYIVVWGSNRTGEVAGVVSEHDTIRDANRAIVRFLNSHQDVSDPRADSAVSAWIADEDEVASLSLN